MDSKNGNDLESVPSGVPVEGNWRRLYAAVLGFLLLLIVGLFFLSRAFSY